jgi:hypothetical protein
MKRQAIYPEKIIGFLRARHGSGPTGQPDLRQVQVNLRVPWDRAFIQRVALGLLRARQSYCRNQTQLESLPMKKHADCRSFLPRCSKLTTVRSPNSRRSRGAATVHAPLTSIDLSFSSDSSIPSPVSRV